MVKQSFKSNLKLSGGYPYSEVERHGTRDIVVRIVLFSSSKLNSASVSELVAKQFNCPLHFSWPANVFSLHKTPIITHQLEVTEIILK